MPSCDSKAYFRWKIVEDVQAFDCLSFFHMVFFLHSYYGLLNLQFFCGFPFLSSTFFWVKFCKNWKWFARVRESSHEMNFWEIMNLLFELLDTNSCSEYNWTTHTNIDPFIQQKITPNTTTTTLWTIKRVSQFRENMKRKKQGIENIKLMHTLYNPFKIANVEFNFGIEDRQDRQTNKQNK